MSLHPLPDKSSGFDPAALKAAIVVGFFILGVGVWGLEMIRLSNRNPWGDAPIKRRHKSSVPTSAELAPDLSTTP